VSAAQSFDARERGSFSLRNLSIQTKLPLIISLLLTAVIATFLIASYQGARQAAVETSAQRLSSLTLQLSTMFQTSARTLITSARTTAGDSSIHRFLRAKNPADRALALAALRAMAPQNAQNAQVTLFDADRIPLLSAVDSVIERHEELAVQFSAADSAPAYGAMGRLQLLKGALVSSSVVAVTDGQHVIGYIARWRRATQAQQSRAQQGRDLLSGLLGSNASMYYGNDRGDLWTDLADVAAPPPVPVPMNGTLVRYTRPGHQPVLAAGRTVPGSPLQLIVEFDEKAVLAPADRFLRRAILIGMILLIAGAAGAWLVSREMTGPLTQLTGAAEAIALGDYEQTVAIDRGDELGRLGRSFNAMMTEVRASHGALREGDRRKDEFLATLAHELRNPMAPLRNAMRLLRMSEGKPVDPAVCEMMDRQLTHMVRLVDDLLEVSRITHGKIELRTQRVRLDDVMRSALETSRPMIERARHEVVTSLPLDALEVDADPVRLAQVFGNLLNNAVKYTAAGGRIIFSARRDKGDAVISVRDDGAGIPADMLSRVFDLFTQVGGTRGSADGGLGIGLALVRQLVALHGGEVEARSAGSGRGSEFLVRLPLRMGTPRSVPVQVVHAAADTGADASRAANVAAPTLSLPRLLIVDDNEDAADSIAALLRARGAETHVVHDGPSALAAMHRVQPQAVLLDIGLPGMSGYDVARQIRSDSAFRDVVLIALTGWGQPQDRMQSEDAGFDEHLVKPVELEVLEATLFARFGERIGDRIGDRIGAGGVNL
jgi:signal transduction histidine kinase/ActR/RegA family two-component response regulator